MLNRAPALAAGTRDLLAGVRDPGAESLVPIQEIGLPTARRPSIPGWGPGHLPFAMVHACGRDRSPSVEIRSYATLSVRLTHTPHERTDRPRNDAYARDRRHRRRRRAQRDVSGSWRDEYRHAGATLPDGGTPAGDTAPEFEPGDRVRDRDGDPDDELLVVAAHDTRADEYRLEAVDGEPTVADVNPGYDPGAAVIGAVYRSGLLDADGWRTLDELRRAVERDDLRAYSFPADRLAPVDDDGPDALGGGRR